MVFVWHDIDKAPPAWEIPTLPESNLDEWTPYYRKRWQLRTHNQEMAENVVDTAHFKYVHGMKIKPEPHIVEANSEQPAAAYRELHPGAPSVGLSTASAAE